MHKQGDEIHVDDTEASGGEKTGHMRWVLGIGTFLAIALLSIIWITGALSQGGEESQIIEPAGVEADPVTSEEEGDDTDGILSDDFEQADKVTPEETVY